MARINSYIKKLAGEEVTLAPPVSRLDKSLSVIAGGENELPPGISAIDRELNDYAESISDNGNEL